MELKEQRKRLRQAFHGVTWPLVGYYGLMHLMGMIFVILGLAIDLLSGADLKDMDALLNDMMNNGWGYLVSSAIAVAAIWLWKGKIFFQSKICKRGKPMKPGRFFGILCVFLSGQFVFQVLTYLFELLLSPTGFSLTESIESASMTAETISMFLYMGVAAPIVEEIIFRGLLLRMMEPFGKKFAMIMSAFLFGIFHGNIVQSPFAFVIGLVLAYVTLEYNITWAMLLHMINNLVLADMLTRLTAPLGVEAMNIISMAVIIGFGVAGVIVLIVKRKAIRLWLSREQIPGEYVRAFFTNPGTIVLSILMLLNMIAFFVL